MKKLVKTQLPSVQLKSNRKTYNQTVLVFIYNSLLLYSNKNKSTNSITLVLFVIIIINQTIN